MESDINHPLQLRPRHIPPIADWLDPPEGTHRNLQITWLTRRFGLSPTFARHLAGVAFERRAR